jgi:hypothetical protein
LIKILQMTRLLTQTKKILNLKVRKNLKTEKDQKNFHLKNIIKKTRTIFLLLCIQSFEWNDLPVKV